MIKAQRLNGETLYINERNIQWIESVPETMITFLNGDKIKINMTLEELVQQVNQSYVQHD
jgi:flagellar protein FlbD